MNNDTTEAYIGIGCLASFLFMIAAWITHIVTCLGTGAWGFLLAGAIFFPIGIIHGFMIWFGLA